MDRETLEREKQAVLYGQTARFRFVKYAILIPLFSAIYFWKGWTVFFIALGFAAALSLAVHLFYRWMTDGWRTSWGGYTPALPRE